MENEVVFEQNVCGYFTRFKVNRGTDGLLVLYKLHVDYFLGGQSIGDEPMGLFQPDKKQQWIIEKKFYSYDYQFFKTMEAASLYLNAYEAASKRGLYEEMNVYRLLVESEAIGNASRSGNPFLSNPFLYNETPQSFIDAAKDYVKYI